MCGVGATRILLLQTLILFASGCLRALSVTCPDGHLCPASLACSPSGGCADPAQVAACVGIDEGKSCTLPGVASGDMSIKVSYCHGGACILAECGNGVVDPGETCDDGTDATTHQPVSGDGCRADCLKIEVCGDGVRDYDATTLKGETCDDGNSNPADACDACHDTTWAETSVVAGDTPCQMGGICPAAVVVDAAGRRYVADAERHRVYRVEASSSVVTPVAGTGTAGFSGDGGAAIGAALDHPAGLALDAAGNLYVADRDNNRVRRVDAQSGVISTVAGTGAFGFAGELGAPAATALFRGPTGLFLDTSSQLLYVADTANHIVRAIDLSGGTAAARISTIAGTPQQLGFLGDCAPPSACASATEALLYLPQDVTRCGNGDLFIADTGSHRVRRLHRTDPLAPYVITTVLGDGIADSAGEGQPAREFPVDTPLGLGCDKLGNLFVTSRTTVRLLPAKLDDALPLDPGVVDGSGPVLNTGVLSTVSPDSCQAQGDLTVCGSGAERCRAGVCEDSLGLLSPYVRGLTGLALLDDASFVVVESSTGKLMTLVRQLKVKP